MAKAKRVNVGVVGRSVLFLIALATVLGFGGEARAQDYADAGTYAVDTSAADAGGAPVDVVVPQGSGPFPLIIASHGWSATNAQQLGWAQHFASWGFVVVAPTFPNTLAPDANVDSKIIEQLVTLYSDPANVSPAQGKVDATRIGLEGHSAGGLASTLAAAAIGPGALVLFDPVDAADAGASAYSSLCIPTMDIFANPSSCNNQEEWSTFASATTAPVVMFSVVGASHCDGENVDRGALCGLVCGGSAEPAHQAVFARYATAFFLAKLKGDPAALAALSASALAADGTISNPKIQAGDGCTTTLDGGPIEQTDAGGSGSDPAPPPTGTPTDPPTSGAADSGAEVGITGSNGSSPSSGGTGSSSSSSGCGCALPGVSATGSPLALVAGVLLVARRRRRAQARG